MKMKKIVTLLWLLLAGTLAYADLKLPNITYIQNTKRTTDNQYQAYLRKNNTSWKNFSEKTWPSASLAVSRKLPDCKFSTSKMGLRNNKR